MINPLDIAVTRDVLVSTLRQIDLKPLLPALDSPTWDAVGRKPAVQKWMTALRLQAEKEISQPLPLLPDELYASFFKTGERLPFEKVYFERRRQLARAAMLVLFGDASSRQKSVPGLIDKIGQTMDEESWTFPAHVWTVPSGKDPMMIDLFAAETANVMGEILTVFGAVLPDELKRRIRERIRRQFIENYLQRHAEFTWTSLPMNWNAVCHQGVIGAALAVEDDPEVLGRMLAIAAPCLRIFLGGFGQDGSTSEGPGYWSYGFGRFADLNAQLEKATGGALSFFGNDEHVRRIATFAPALAFSNGHLVNFSDGPRHGRLGAPLLGYLGKRLELPILCQESAALYHHMLATGLDLQEQRSDFYFLVRLFLSAPDADVEAPEPSWPDVFFPDYGAVVARGRDQAGNRWEFAAKGGHNDEHHNHNDCGSFLLNFNGKPAIVEIGAPEYVHGYFGTEQRYTFLAARSLGHSVPYVNGCEQASGLQSAAVVLACEIEPERLKFVVDLTRSYPVEAGCRSLIRTFTLEKPAGVLAVSDAYELEKEGVVESILILPVPLVPGNGGGTIEAAGGTLRLILGEGIGVSEDEACDYKDNRGVPQRIHRVRFRPAKAAKSGVIRYEIHGNGVPRS